MIEAPAATIEAPAATIEAPAAMIEKSSPAKLDLRIIAGLMWRTWPYYKPQLKHLITYMCLNAAMGAVMVSAGFSRTAPSVLPVFRRMPASLEAVRDEILASPNEPALRAAGDATLERIVSEILAGVERFREGEMLAMPQQAHLFDVTAV